MTRDDIIRMAREAGFDTSSKEVYVWLGQERVLKELVTFAALVAAAEREACARACEELMKWYEAAHAVEAEAGVGLYDDGFRIGEATGAEACAEAIRRWGEK